MRVENCGQYTTCETCIGTDAGMDGDPYCGWVYSAQKVSNVSCLIKMRVENCGQYTTCETCIGTDAGMDGDPYCGWCTLHIK